MIQLTQWLIECVLKLWITSSPSSKVWDLFSEIRSKDEPLSTGRPNTLQVSLTSNSLRVSSKNSASERSVCLMRMSSNLLPEWSFRETTVSSKLIAALYKPNKKSLRWLVRGTVHRSTTPLLNPDVPLCWFRQRSGGAHLLWKYRAVAIFITKCRVGAYQCI